MSEKICLDVSGERLDSPDEIYVYTTKAPDGFAGKIFDGQMTIDGVDYYYFEVEVKDKDKITNPSKKIIKKDGRYHEEIDGISAMETGEYAWYAAQIANKDVLIDDEKIGISTDIMKEDIPEGNIIREKIEHLIDQDHKSVINRIYKQFLYKNFNSRIAIFSYNGQKIEEKYFNVINTKKIDGKQVGFYIVRYNYINRDRREQGCFDVKICTPGYKLNKYTNILNEIKHLNDFYSQCVYLKPNDRLEFIIMPKIEGTIKELWGTREDNFCKIIKSIVSQAYCLYKLGYLYVDMRSKNILYRKDKDGNINIILEDLGHMMLRNKPDFGKYENLQWNAEDKYIPMDLWNFGWEKVEKHYTNNPCKLVVWGIGIVILEFLGYNDKATQQRIYPTTGEVKTFYMGIELAERDGAGPHLRKNLKETIARNFIQRHPSIFVNYRDSYKNLIDKIESAYGNSPIHIEELQHGIEKLENITIHDKDKEDKLKQIIIQTIEETNKPNLYSLLNATLTVPPEKRPTLEKLYHNFEFN